MDVVHFWGKAQPLDPERGPRWHPLVHHSLDVAAVGEALLTSQPRLGDTFSTLLGLPREAVVPLLRFLLCLHDIGKFAMKFQAKVPAHYPECFGNDPAGVATRFDHGTGGMRLFRAEPERFLLPEGARERAWPPLVSAVTGHHGAPPEHPGDEGLTALRPEFGQAGIEAAHAFVERARGLLGPPQELRTLTTRNAKRASYSLAGLAVLADWIGSRQEWFPYCEPTEDLETYWSEARKRAGRAVAEAGVVPASASRGLYYGDLLGDRASPSPMQKWAGETALPDGPALFLIEDETGSGKTEAALMLAHRLMANGAADGLYVALPTMATANAMFDRLEAAYRHLFAPETEPSLALAHGARDMHSGFRDATLRGGRCEASYARGHDSGDASETTASSACAAWLADDRRRAFLADAGAGTIDQALLAVLPCRHQSLRLLGLSRRVLILDEVHAYDAYMQREMERLIEFQAGLGGSVILLSATLPACVRERLTDAFAKGLDSQADSADPSMDYPMITVCSADVTSSTKIEGRSDRARTLPVRFLASPDDALDEVREAALAGKAVLYIRNSVDDALDAHAALVARGLEPDLFHARFALADRLEIEKRIVATFGKHSRTKCRAGRVLIATQVVEQSLDLDFDVLISDLAPIDLLIQRAGRLWRHARPERAGQPELLVVAPEPIDDADQDWFGRAFPRAKYVYRDHARLWLSARALKDTGEIESPAGLRALIESVYGDDSFERLPEALHGVFFDADGRAGADRGVATMNLLDFSKGYVRDGGAWDNDARTPTRINDDPQVTLRLARVCEGRVEPYARHAAGEEPWRAWRLSEVNVAARRVSGEAVPSRYAFAARAAKAQWTRFDEDKILIVLEGADDGGRTMTGSATTGDGSGTEVRISYDPVRGLQMTRDS